MDVDFWAARVRRRIPSIESSTLGNSGNHLSVEDEGGDEVMRAWFPCPFCYIEIELPVLCLHIQEEHCFSLKNAVCPICAANLGKDAVDHFASQHAHSIKRRKKSQNSNFWSNASSNIIKDLWELSSFIGSNPSNGPGSGNEPPLDPLLSPFLRRMPLTVPKDSHKDIPSCIAKSDAESKLPCLDGVEAHEEEMRERVAFVHELLISTIF